MPLGPNATRDLHEAEKEAHQQAATHAHANTAGEPAHEYSVQVDLNEPLDPDDEHVHYRYCRLGVGGVTAKYLPFFHTPGGGLVCAQGRTSPA